jgi:acetyl-CoA carboxylase carboxyltransferase component
MEVGFMATTAEKIAEFHRRLDHIMQMGGQKNVDRQHSRGKLTARERLNLLFDENSFVEVNAFRKHRCYDFGMEKKDLPADGVVTGYGTVNGRLVFAFAQDFTVAGGSMGEIHGQKIVHVQELAMKTGSPIVGLYDSGGARIQDGINSQASFGKIFWHNTLASGLVPQISAIMGPCAGGAVYSPALTDFVFMVQGTSQMFLTGPKVVESVTGEKISKEALGGAMTHNTHSGVSQFAPKTDQECIAQIRELLSYLPSNNLEDAPAVEPTDDPTRTDESLNSIVPDDSNTPYDMYKVIRSVVDNGKIYDVAQYFAKNAITCFARMDGQTVGIIASQPAFMAGCMDYNSSDKIARFIRFCDCFNIPLVTFEDVPGFLPGRQQEYAGVIRHGAKILYAYSEATVPKVTIITRKGYGGSYIAFCCRQLGADQVFAWPTAECAVMGPSGAARIIFKNDPNIEQRTQEYIDRFANPYQAAEMGDIDAVIEPKDTRPYIINALKMLQSKQEVHPNNKHGNIPL